MNYEEKVLNFMKENSDTININEINELNIPRITMTRLINKGIVERNVQGLYTIKDSFGDEYYNLLYNSKNAVFSHLTALYFQNLCERVPIKYDVTVKQNYAGNLIKNKKVILHYVDDKIFNLGLINIKSPQGRIVRCYDAERCLCDLTKNKNNTYLEYLKYAFNEYYKVEKHDTKKLYEYARKMNIYNKLKTFVEIFI